MAFIPKFPVIPRIKLPKLPTLNAFVPFVSLPLLSVAARGKLICGLLTQALSPIQKAFQTLSGLTSDDVGNKVKSTLNSVKGGIVKQINGVVDAALAQATGAIKSLIGVPQGIIESFKSASEDLKKQGQNIKKIITDEIDCVSDSVSSVVTAAGVTSTIEKQTIKKFNNLSNNEQKELLENSAAKETYINTIAEPVITEASKSITNAISSDYLNQVITVNKLQNLVKT